MPNDRSDLLEIYTDGSAKKMKVGGWAYIFVDAKNSTAIRKNNGNEAPTTNQRMELLAAANALEDVFQLKEHRDKMITLFSDSAYLINCYLQEWWKNWQNNGWRNAKKQPVANQDLWLRIIPYFTLTRFDFQKVKGHANVYWNNECDELAQAAADKLLEEKYGL